MQQIYKFRNNSTFFISIRIDNIHLFFRDYYFTRDKSNRLSNSSLMNKQIKKRKKKKQSKKEKKRKKRNEIFIQPILTINRLQSLHDINLMIRNIKDCFEN